MKKRTKKPLSIASASTGPFRHWTDKVSQHRIDGWTTAPWFDLAVNDSRIARITPDLPRPDLIEAGVGPGAGFTYMLPQPLWIDDAVSLHGPDGTILRTTVDAPTQARVRELTRHFNPATQPGLEIGPLDRPLIPRLRFRIRQLDQARREDLLARYTGHGVVFDAISEPDFIADGRPFAAIMQGHRFAYAVASHVIEHIPDMVGWLWQIWSVLEDGGVLALAIPHGTHTFDSRRNLSTMADLADAFFTRLTHPSARQIIDAAIGSARHSGADLAEATFEAIHLANHARKVGLYVDTHCNVFTPDSFTSLLTNLAAVELLGFDLISTAYPGGDEFFVHLRKDAAKQLPDHISP